MLSARARLGFNPVHEVCQIAKCMIRRILTDVVDAIIAAQPTGPQAQWLGAADVAVQRIADVNGS